MILPTEGVLYKSTYSPRAYQHPLGSLRQTELAIETIFAFDVPMAQRYVYLYMQRAYAPPLNRPRKTMCRLEKKYREKNLFNQINRQPFGYSNSSARGLEALTSLTFMHLTPHDVRKLAVGL